MTGNGEKWIKAGFAELARSGVEGVRVEVLAKNLGVTKGGFYRRFKDRAALLDAMLQDWSTGRIAAIEQQASLEGETARERLEALIRLYSERMNTEGMAIELAIRPSFIAQQGLRATRPTQKPSCSIASSSARACCFSTAASANAPSLSQNPQRDCWTNCKIRPVAFVRRRPAARYRGSMIARVRPKACLSKNRDLSRCPNRSGPFSESCSSGSGCALQPPVAFGIITAALLDPLHAAIAVACLVGIVLIDASVHASLAGGLL